MKVLQFNSRKHFGKFGPGTPDPAPQGPLVTAAIKLTSWLPTIVVVLAAAVAIMFISWLPAIVVVLATDSAIPLYAFAARDLIGLLIGILIYRRSSRSPISCGPTHENPDLPVEEIKKAA